MRGHRETIGERLRRDCEALMVLPPAPFDACDRQGTRVSSLSLVRYRTNDYSVPVAYGHREVWIRGYVHEVVIGCGGGIIARPPRSYERDDMVFDPIHYLPLLEQKIAALDQAAPLAGWELPDAFPTLRRLLEARMGKSGKREYVQVLRLLETFDLEALHGAVKDALRLGAIGYDAVKHLVLCRIERRPAKLDLDVYPYLPRANVATTGDRQLYEPVGWRRVMTDTPQLLLVHHLKTLKLPTFLREYDKLARQCAAEGADHVRYLVRLAELELIDRERRMVERRIRQARFPAVKSLDSFDFKAIPSLNKMLVVELARCEYVERRENIIALGNSGTGKTHIALGLGLAACQKGLSVGFTTAAALVHELMEARDEKRLLRFRSSWLNTACWSSTNSALFRSVKPARTAVRGVQPALRARRHSGDLQPAVRRMDQDIRLGTSDRRIAGPAHPPCPYPGDERRELSSQPKPKTAKIPKTACLTVNAMVDPVGPQAPPTLLRSA